MAPTAPDNAVDSYFRSQQPCRTLYRLVGLTWYEHIGYALLHAAKALPIYLAPLLLAEVIHAGSDPANYPLQRLVVWFVAYAVILLLNPPLDLLYVRMTSRSTRRIERALRAALVKRLQELSIAYHTDTESGRIQSKLLRDVDGLTELITVYFGLGVNAVLLLIWSFTVALTKDPLMALVYLVLGPFTAGTAQFFFRRIHRRNREFREQVEGMSSRLTEMIHLVPVTRAHGVEKVELETLEKHFAEVYQRGRKLDRITGVFRSFGFVSFRLGIFLTLVVSGLMAYHGLFEVQKVALYNGLFWMVIEGVNGILWMLPAFTKGFESIRSIGEVLESPDIEANAGKDTVSQVRGEIRFEEVCFAYPKTERRAVYDINFQARPGECIAFVGESGSGKTTLMNLTIGFIRPQQGRILLDGRDLQHLDMRTVRRFVAVVPQNTLLFSGTIRDNIVYGLDSVTPERLASVIEAAHLKAVIDGLPQGLETRVGENGVKLSGGQRQRVAIARALIRDPRIIILDEATSALDVISEAEVQAAINNLIQGRTTFIVAHRLSTIRQAHRILVLKEGRVIESGTQEQLLTREGEFARLKALQS